ncbi:hypothetical protein [Neisseria dentiae]|uniref:hypothetical protein n=1 Tax=Neisseria dentiae TaxID=194197 RepID=UPI001359DA24|nr:hypothetical protein [Neisseria dentiae]
MGIFIMAQPNKYNPITRFSNSSYSTSRSKIEPLALDTELKNISDSINNVVTNLAKIQRDDGNINDAALGEYYKKIEQDALSSVDARISSTIGGAAKSAVDAYILSGAVKAAVDAYVRTLTFPNGGTTPRAYRDNRV